MRYERQRLNDTRIDRDGIHGKARIHNGRGSIIRKTLRYRQCRKRAGERSSDRLNVFLHGREARPIRTFRVQ